MLSRMIVVMAMAASGVSCAAQQSMQSKGGAAGPMSAAAPEATPEKAPSADVPRATPPVPDASGLSSEEGLFHFPILRSVTFAGVNHLTGVLVRTPQGTLQIERFQWGIDEEEGYVYMCYLRGYTREGELISLGSPDGCESSLSKNQFLRALAATESGFALTSFDFGTDQKGYLLFLNPVYEEVYEGRDDSACSSRRITSCASNSCNGSCGVAAPPVMAGDGRGFETPPSLSSANINCACSGTTGSCEAEVRYRCRGLCAEGRSCGVDEDDASCQCE